MAHNAYDKNIFSNDLAAALYKNINAMMLDCISRGAVPYVEEKPLPQDMNVVNGRHFGDINKILLELKASQIGAKSLKWIYKADADFIGLELKGGIDSSSIDVYANVNRNGENKTESQKVYLLDQFAEESVKNALELTRTDGNSKEEIQKRAVAQNMIRNIAEYDSGANERRLRENKRKNISANLKDMEIAKSVSTAYDNATEQYDDSQKLLFGTLNRYYIKQETGLNLGQPMSKGQTAAFVDALEAAAKIDSPRLAQTLAESFLYSERLTHYEFNPERIYTQEDLNKSLNIFAPAASQFEPKVAPSLEKNREIEKIMEREQEMKPRHISHSRGL